MSQEQDLLLTSIKNKVFSEVKGELLIGGEKIKPELRSVLKEQAKYLSTSQIWEVITSTIKQEASDMALKDSKNWDHVLMAKALYHWGYVFENMIRKLKT